MTLDPDLQALLPATATFEQSLAAYAEQRQRNTAAAMLANQTAMVQVASDAEKAQDTFLDLVKTGAEVYSKMLTPGTVTPFYVGQAISYGLSAAKANYAVAKAALDAIKAGNAP
jgi:hypothetical protein